MRRKLMVALLIMLAGCSGLNGGATPTQTSDATSPIETTTAAPSDSSPADVTASNTVNYTALSPAEQRAFDTAQQGEVGFAPESVRESPYVNKTYVPTDLKETFQNHEYVQKNGSYYQLSWDVGPTIASYNIQITEQQPPKNATSVALENLSSPVREPVQNAIQNGSYDTPFGKWDSYPASLENIEYIQYNEGYYKIDLLAGDFWADQMSANLVE